MFNFLMDSLTTQIVIIVLCIVGIIVFLTLFVGVEYIVFKHYRKKVQILIKDIGPFEEQRLALAKKCFEVIKNSGKKYNKSMDDMLIDIESIIKDDITEKRSYAKQALDVLLTYSKKFFNEYKITIDSELSEEMETTFKMMGTFYDKYNRAANMHNAFLGLWLLRPFVRKYTRAIVF